MADTQQILRHWKLLRILSNRRYGATLRELADELGASQKTIGRDLKMLGSLGFPIGSETRDYGLKVWKLAPSDAQIPPLGFNYEEAAALYLGSRYLEPLAGTCFWESACGALRKIRAAVGENARAYLDKIGRLVHHAGGGVVDYSQKAEIIDELTIACEERHITSITYHSLRSTRPSDYEIHPLGLIYFRGALYVVANSTAHGEIRHFKVDRISAVEQLELQFSEPAEFDLAAHLAQSFGVWRGDGRPITIRVRFAPAVARYVTERTWHASQRLTSEPDGGLLAEFELDDTEEIKHWLLGFGPNAEVLEPEVFREEMVDTLQSMLSCYRADEPAPQATEQLLRRAK